MRLMKRSRRSALVTNEPYNSIISRLALYTIVSTLVRR
jgi:hypothetical protein